MTQPDDLDAPDALLTPSEVAALFRVNPKTVTRWARSGKLTAIRTLKGRLETAGTPVEVLWAGTADGLEAKVASDEGISFATVATGKIRRSSNPLKLASPQNMKDMGRVPVGVAQARTLDALEAQLRARAKDRPGAPTAFDAADADVFARARSAVAR